jgi:hypothetical protein
MVPRPLTVPIIGGSAMQGLGEGLCYAMVMVGTEGRDVYDAG